MRDKIEDRDGCTIGEYLIDEDDTNYSTDMMPHLTTSYKRNSNAWTALALGLLSMVAWIVPLCGIAVTVVGTGFGITGIFNKRHRNVAVIGLILNLVFLVIAVVKLCLGKVRETHTL